MSTRRRYRSGSWCIDIMDKPWFVDVLTYVLVGIWMAWTFASIQQYGPDPWLLASAVIVLAAGMLLVYNQRLAYLRIGDRVVLGTKEAMEADDQEPPELQREE